jgi:HAD superfamily hydrolase (TIGR01484 family)
MTQLVNTRARHLFFDVDNTLTRTKSPALPEHEHMLLELSKAHDLVLVSGSPQQNIWNRFPLSNRGHFSLLAQNGNAAFDKQHVKLWERMLTEAQKQAAYRFIEKVRAHTHPTVVNEGDLIEDRGCQIAFSFIGHNADVSVKETFDPNFSVRKKVLLDLAADVTHLAVQFELEVTIGGSTNLDIYLRGKHKGYNTKAFADYMQWNTTDCLYFGDALIAGGNDYTVVGVMPVQNVANYLETYAFLKQVL